MLSHSLRCNKQDDMTDIADIAGHKPMLVHSLPLSCVATSLETTVWKQTNGRPRANGVGTQRWVYKAHDTLQ